MLGLSLDSARRNFFDPSPVARAARRAQGDVGDRIGAYLMRVARNSIKPAGKRAVRKFLKAKDAGDQDAIDKARQGLRSKPGNPPFGHGRNLLRNNIFFVTVHGVTLVGPAKLNQVNVVDGKPKSGTVPEILENSGTIGTIEVYKWGKWRRADMRSKRRLAGLKVRTRDAKVAARPFMAPALAKSKQKQVEFWKDTIHS